MLAKILAGGGLTAALTASTCCVVPLTLASLGAGTAWVSAFSFLAPYQTAFRVAAILMLAAAFWLVYRPRTAGAACAVTPSQRLTKASLWAGAAIVGIVITSGWWERFIV